MFRDIMRESDRDRVDGGVELKFIERAINGDGENIIE